MSDQPVKTRYTEGPNAMDLPTMHATLDRLARERGRPRFWRSLDEAAGQPVAAPSAPAAPAAPGNSLAVGRRGLLKVMGASAAVGGLAACTKQHPEKLVPYVDAPEEIIPGKPLFFATTISHNGSAIGVLAESHMGRPVKLEGNPRHPASLGGLDAIPQAAIMDLYDPDRSQQVVFKGRPSDWTSFTKTLAAIADAQSAAGVEGQGIRLALESHASPFVADRVAAVLKKFPKARVHYFDAVGHANARTGARVAFGKALAPVYRFDQADVVLALDADFTSWAPGSLRHARDFASRRRAVQDGVKLNRLYAVDAMPSPTSGLADHRLAAKPSRVATIAKAVAHGLGLAGEAPAGLDAEETAFVAMAVEDLKAAGGKSVVVVGETQPAGVHALAHAINEKLGAFGQTVSLIDAPGFGPSGAEDSFETLLADLRADQVELVILFGVNPVYAAPADLKVAEALAKAKTSVHVGLYTDETAAACTWHINGAHELETWGDGVAFDGTVSLRQPLILPLYHGKSVVDVVSLLNGDAGNPAYELLKAFWKGRNAIAGDFDAGFRKALHDGVIEGSAPAHQAAAVLAPAVQASLPQDAPAADGVEIQFRPDPMVWDGRHANNGWLQEAPRPVTTIVWDNALLVGVATARKLQLANGILPRNVTYPKNRMVRVEVNGARLELPLLVVPGHAEGCATLHFGQGRTAGMGVTTRMEDPETVVGVVGFDVNPLRRSDSPWSASGAKLSLAAREHHLAMLQDHFSQENRHLYRSVSKASFDRDPNQVKDLSHTSPNHFTLYGNKWDHLYGKDGDPNTGTGYQWAMVVDLSTCNGCNACITACQAENNTAVVGKHASLNGREMHWLRVDRYFEGDPDHDSPSAVRVAFQPIPCMQCENAPCETVCPVGATTHSNDGLNQMVYNRCVGTRYCANNCPYKVRRFNFYKFSDLKSESLKLMRNPDVTVRARGVMEKCTYCVQRINHARIDARLQGREIRDGEVVTACEQACPTASITFGNKRDPNSRVTKLRKTLLNYTLLDELNSRPRTSYLASVKNPNAKAEPAAPAPDAHAAPAGGAHAPAKPAAHGGEKH